MHSHNPYSILSAEEVTQNLISEFETRITNNTKEPGEALKTNLSPLRVRYTPGSVTIMDTLPEKHDQQLYNTWSFYALEQNTTKASESRNILFCSTYRRSFDIMTYAVSLMCDFDLQMSEDIWPTKGDMMNLKEVVDHLKSWPFHFVDLNDISQPSLSRLSDSIEKVNPGLIIIELEQQLSVHNSLSYETEKRLQELATTHHLAIVILSKRIEPFLYSPG